ncbi:MAG TPA: DUF169 domain-containing protein [Methanocella sp.]|nr:DUF169 domain-containing protein [Methanocella sp.]
MSIKSASIVGEKLRESGRLELEPLCVYSPAEMSEGIVQVSDLIEKGGRCLAKAVMLVAAGEADAVGISRGSKGVCRGALCFMGYAPVSKPMMADIAVRGKDAAYLKGTEGICDSTIDSIGQITPPGDHIVISTCDFAGDIEPLSYLCFGNAEQIRNLCGLIHFSAESAFGQIEAPWGSGCSLFVTYPAGMAAGAPKETAFLGPTAADGNPWFPADTMSLSLPATVANRMAADADRSFVIKCPEIAYPPERDKSVTNAIAKLRSNHTRVHKD